MWSWNTSRKTRITAWRGGSDLVSPNPDTFVFQEVELGKKACTLCKYTVNIVITYIYQHATSNGLPYISAFLMTSHFFFPGSLDILAAQWRHCSDPFLEVSIGAMQQMLCVLWESFGFCSSKPLWCRDLYI